MNHQKKLFSVGVCLMLAIGAFLLHSFFTGKESGPEGTITLGYSHGGPIRLAFLKTLVDEAKDAGVEIKLMETKGMEETLQLVEAGKLDTGMIMSGLEDEDPSDLVREIVPLYQEPLHLLVRKDLYEAVQKDFGALKGKVINLDGRLTGTHVMAWELLRFAGFVEGDKPNFRPSYLMQDELLANAAKGVKPDAVFISAAVPSPMVKDLVSLHGYRLVELPYGDSFSLEDFRHTASADRVDGTVMSLNRQFVQESVVPAFAYSVQPPVPARELRTIGSRLVLVGNRDFNVALTARLVEIVLSPNVSHRSHPALTPALLDLPFEYDRHDGTERYLRSQKSITVDDAIDFYEEVMKKWGIALAIYFMLANAAKRLMKFLRRRDEEEEAAKPEKAIDQLRLDVISIDKELGLALQSGATPAQAHDWHKRLHQVRLRALDVAISAEGDESLRTKTEALMAHLRDVSGTSVRVEKTAGFRKSA